MQRVHSRRDKGIAVDVGLYVHPRHWLRAHCGHASSRATGCKLGRFVRKHNAEPCFFRVSRPSPRMKRQRRKRKGTKRAANREPSFRKMPRLIPARDEPLAGLNGPCDDYVFNLTSFHWIPVCPRGRACRCCRSFLDFFETRQESFRDPRCFHQPFVFVKGRWKGLI